jgi:DNA-binding transcriptional LysR family regulator
MRHALADPAPGTVPLHLSALVAFEAVARHASFARAAEEMDVSPTAISKTVKQLEARLGMRLFNRTTRRVGLTEAGALLLESLAPALRAIRASLQAVGEAARAPRGNLRITTSGVAYDALIEAHLPAFAQRYPDIGLEFSLDNQFVDIVAGGYDAGIRLGESVERDMVAVPVGPLQQMVVVGSRAYFSRHPEPATPRELLGHDCIRQRLPRSRRLVEWEFGGGRKTLTIAVDGQLILDDMGSIIAAARRGLGLAYVFRPLVAADLGAGRLRALLERYGPPPERFHLYYPSGRQLPGKLRAFIDFMRTVHGA